MNRNQRRQARDAKRAPAEAILGRVASGNHLTADNDEPEREPGERHVLPNCTACTVCGGKADPSDDRLCQACRGLARTFAALEAGPLDLQRAIDQRRGHL
jgi:hypothetical protein